MIKNILTAAVKMLDDDEGKITIESFKARVGCAKIILEELIVNLESKLPNDPAFTEEDDPEPLPQPRKKPAKRAPEAEQYEVVVDAGILQGIKNLPLDAAIEVDGKVTTHAEAIGKPFQNGRIL